MGKRVDKTNVMRFLDSKKISYNYYTYSTEMVNAVEVANHIGKDPAAVFKTLVTKGKSGELYVFMIPSEKELDLKKAAHAAGEKSLDMLPYKQLLPLTGYVHGGCSPIGMKKQFKTFIDTAAQSLEKICISAGQVGFQVELALTDLQSAITIIISDITKSAA